MPAVAQEVLACWEQAGASADPAALCVPRPLVTDEWFVPNAFYGNDLVLKLHAGLPPAWPLPVVLPHGIDMSDSFVWKAEEDAPLPAILTYNEQRRRAWAGRASKLAIPAAVPFAYAVRLCEPLLPREGRGTLCFPSHSSQYVTANADYDGIADALLALGPRFQPITVCMYWRDMELGHHEPFQRRGHAVACAGHIHDPLFLFRLLGLVARHARTCSNFVGSHVIYSLLAGRPHFLLRGFDPDWTGREADVKSSFSRPEDHWSGIETAFGQERWPLDERGERLLRDVAGLDHLLEPQDLRRLLLALARLDRFGVARDPGSGRWLLGAPRALPRALRRGLGRARRALARRV